MLEPLGYAAAMMLHALPVGVVAALYVLATRRKPQQPRPEPPRARGVARSLVPMFVPGRCQHPARHLVKIKVNGELMTIAWICKDAKCGEHGVYSRWIAHGVGEPD